MTDLYEDDYPEGIERKSLDLRPSTITWWDVAVISGIWLGVVAIAFGIVLGVAYLAAWVLL